MTGMIRRAIALSLLGVALVATIPAILLFIIADAIGGGDV